MRLASQQVRESELPQGGGQSYRRFALAEDKMGLEGLLDEDVKVYSVLCDNESVSARIGRFDFLS